MSPLVRSPTKYYHGGQDDTPDQQATSQPTPITHLHFNIPFSSAFFFLTGTLFLSLFLQPQVVLGHRSSGLNTSGALERLESLVFKTQKNLDIWAADFQLVVYVHLPLSRRLLPDCSIHPETQVRDFYNPSLLARLSILW